MPSKAALLKRTRAQRIPFRPGVRYSNKGRIHSRRPILSSSFFACKTAADHTFHVVFTLPHELNPLALTTPRRFFDLLFEASSQTLLEVAADPKWLGAEIGFLSILHTWSSNLLPHYHVHCVVPGGGLSADHQRWIQTSHPLFLLPIPVLRTVFRKKFLDRTWSPLPQRPARLPGPAADFRDPAWFEQLIAKLGKKDWFVYAKPPFGGPATCPRAISAATPTAWPSPTTASPPSMAKQVRFRWRDYAHGGKQRVMPLDAVEFLRRFFLHVLPRGFVRIRHYGLLSNRFRKQLLPLARTLLAAQGREPLPPPPPPDCDLWHCPRCGAPMRVVERFTAAQLYFAGLDSS